MFRNKTTLKLLAVLAGILLTAAACGDSSGTSPAGAQSDSGAVELEVRPFAEIQASDFVFEADPFDPNRGIFRVTTTEESICTIVWGETEDFGNFNNSLEMNGTGIIDHNVFLPGAEQGKEYFFRVQGFTSDGRIFASETGTFTIPVVEDSGDAAGGGAEMAVHGDNLALGATVVDVSSEFSDTWKAANAIDGDPSTEWATAGDGDEGFITIDLGSPQEVVGVEFITRSMANGTAITDEFTITVDDGETFGPFPAGNPADPRFAAVEFTGQVIRFDVANSTGGNVGAVEVNVFAPAG